MEYTLYWIDAYNTWNHRNENIDEENDLMEDGVCSKSGYENLKQQFPIYEIEHYDGDGWIDCCHKVDFEASNIEKAKMKVREILDQNGRIVDVFSVYKNKESILTEEDF